MAARDCPRSQLQMRSLIPKDAKSDTDKNPDLKCETTVELESSSRKPMWHIMLVDAPTL